MTSKPQLLKHRIELGMHHHRVGQIDAAVAEYRRALAIEPGDPEALQLLGTAELQLGKAQDAAHTLERAARALDHPAILGSLAQAYFTLGRFADAHDTFCKASKLDPRHVGFQIGMASTLAMQGKLAQAETALRGIVEHHPREIRAWFNLGHALRDQHKAADALVCYSKVTELDPQFADGHNNLGTALHTLYRFDDAEKAYRACLALAPDHAQARLNLASVTIDAGKFADAETVCREIVSRAPDNPFGHTLLGVALSCQGRIRGALSCHHKAAQLAPNDAKAAQALAGALATAGDIDAALSEFARALTLDPQSFTVRPARAGALLAAGRFAQGWDDYLHRPASKEIKSKHAQLNPTRSLPAELLGATLLLLGEQGLGDELFFLRFAPVLRAAGAAMTYRGSGKLKSVLDRVDCLSLVLEESSVPPPTDAVMLIGDLPHALNEYATRGRSERGALAATARSETPPPLALTPHATRLEAIRERLRKVGNPPYLGVSWRGGISPRDQTGADWSLFKSIDLDALANALRPFPGSVVALQRYPNAAEIEHFSQILGTTMHDFSTVNEDLEDMLALLALIDEYVGVSNTNMHLRAGLGKHARVLVPQPADWRWMATGNSSPWFPGFSVYRQSDDGDWNEALAALGRDLHAHR
jgi:tetratricopeptide (TPR) repeat protein